MRINDEKYERGSLLEHASGCIYRYEGRIHKSHMWGLFSNEDSTSWHVIADPETHELYLETDHLFIKNYREPGTWQEPERGQDWHHKGMTRTVRVRKVVDDLVIYDYVNEIPKALPVHYCQTVDSFKEEFRHGSR